MTQKKFNKVDSQSLCAYLYSCTIINVHCLLQSSFYLGYSEVSESVQSKELVIMDKIVTCSEGWVRYLLSTAQHTDEFSVSDDFYYSVRNLPLSYDEDKYIQFIENWGTVRHTSMYIYALLYAYTYIQHYVEEVNAGGRLTTRFQSSYEELYQYASENVSDIPLCMHDYHCIILSLVTIYPMMPRACRLMPVYQLVVNTPGTVDPSHLT